MNAAVAPSRIPDRLRGRDISELAVMVRFGDLVVAVAALRVFRIVSAEDAVPALGARTPSVRIGDAVLPAWDLGELLGFSEPPAAWLMMTTSDQPGAPTIALGTGPCIAVSSHGAVSPLPVGVIDSPPDAVIGVFVTDAVLRERGVGHLGVRIDPIRWITAWSLAGASGAGH